MVGLSPLVQSPTRGPLPAMASRARPCGRGRGRGLRTCTGRSCTCVGRHCTLRLLQQPEQRCTSTHGGHTRKLALVRSMRRREISNTSVRVLHSAIMAGSAAVREPGEGRGCHGRRGAVLSRTCWAPLLPPHRPSSDTPPFPSPPTLWRVQDLAVTTHGTWSGGWAALSLSFPS
jgi:hypothetical protein